jgi:hypothetical protein
VLKTGSSKCGISKKHKFFCLHETIEIVERNPVIALIGPSSIAQIANTP